MKDGGQSDRSALPPSLPCIKHSRVVLSLSELRSPVMRCGFETRHDVGYSVIPKCGTEMRSISIGIMGIFGVRASRFFAVLFILLLLLGSTMMEVDA